MACCRRQTCCKVALIVSRKEILLRDACYKLHARYRTVRIVYVRLRGMSMHGNEPGRVEKPAILGRLSETPERNPPDVTAVAATCGRAMVAVMGLRQVKRSMKRKRAG